MIRMMKTKMKMIKIGLCAAFMLMCGCNMQVIDLEFKFNKAVVRWPNGELEVIPVKKWCDYEASDQIQIIDKDGNVYIFHSVNIVLMNDSGKERHFKNRKEE